jgi:23S rRNA (uridine2552-2'-O)-methyltransferase
VTGVQTCALPIFECARKLLKPEGRFAVKVFMGDMFPEFLSKVRQVFAKVQAFTPKATRKQSAEIYVIGKRLLQDVDTE